MSEFSWGLFLAVAVGAIFVALGLSFGPVMFLLGLIVLFLAFRYPYSSLYTAFFLSPFLGLTLSIPTGELEASQHAFGGSIDISIAEGLLLVILFSWSLKIIFLWYRRNDHNWRPRLPLAASYATLVLAHIVSVFSVLQPDITLTLKFAMRPVLFMYLAFVALPVNYFRSRRRLTAILFIMSIVGTIAALNGAVSLFFVDASSQGIHRAHPLPMFGVPVLGDNHNLLAELMVVTVMMTLALSYLVKQEKQRHWVYAFAGLQLVIGLLTFSRTGWIVFSCEAMALGLVEYPGIVKKYSRQFIAGAFLLIPIVGVMLGIVTSNVASSSNDTRVALLEIAWQIFNTSPWIGAGAGTFMSHVADSRVFSLEFGAALDAHGFLQKLAAETGLFGLTAFALVIADAARRLYRGWKNLPPGPHRRVLFVLSLSAAAGVLYQFFNTNYWTAKMWLPIGIALAAINALSGKLPEEKKNIV